MKWKLPTVLVYVGNPFELVHFFSSSVYQATVHSLYRAFKIIITLNNICFLHSHLFK